MMLLFIIPLIASVKHVAAVDCSSYLVSTIGGRDNTCSNAPNHFWPIGDTSACHGWQGFGGGRMHKNSANNIRCSVDGQSILYTQYANSLDCSGRGVEKRYGPSCERGIPTVLYDKAGDLSCCSDPDGEACQLMFGTPSAPNPGVSNQAFYLNGDLCDGSSDADLVDHISFDGKGFQGGEMVGKGHGHQNGGVSGKTGGKGNGFQNFAGFSNGKGKGVKTGEFLSEMGYFQNGGKFAGKMGGPFQNGGTFTGKGAQVEHLQNSGVFPGGKMGAKGQGGFFKGNFGGMEQTFQNSVYFGKGGSSQNWNTSNKFKMCIHLITRGNCTPLDNDRLCVCL